MLLVFLIALCASAAHPPSPEVERNSACALLKTKEVLRLFQTDCGRYPTKEDGALKALVVQPKRACKRWGIWDLKSEKAQAYIKKLPRDPWGRLWIYTPIDDDHYKIQSLGSDGKPGGTGLKKDFDADEFLQRFRQLDAKSC